MFSNLRDYWSIKLNSSSNGVLLDGVAKPTNRDVVNRNFGLGRPTIPTIMTDVGPELLEV